MKRPDSIRTPLLDPGWLFLLAGLALLSATVLIPAQDDLEHARWLRARAAAVEQHRIDRITRYEEFLAALDEGKPSLILALAANQLNQVPADRAPIPGLTFNPTSSASPFPSLEPPPVRLPERTKPTSMLYRWSTSDSARVWLLVAGATCVLIGLLPASRGWGAIHRRHPYLQN